MGEHGNMIQPEDIVFLNQVCVFFDSQYCGTDFFLLYFFDNIISCFIPIQEESLNTGKRSEYW